LLPDCGILLEKTSIPILSCVVGFCIGTSAGGLDAPGSQYFTRKPLGILRETDICGDSDLHLCSAAFSCDTETDCFLKSPQELKKSEKT
jgi:hypothetical protein